MSDLTPEAVAVRDMTRILRLKSNHPESDWAVAADLLEALTTRLAEVEAEKREMAMQSLADLGQAQEAYEAQLAAEAEVARLAAELAEARKVAWGFRSYATHDNDCKVNKPPHFDQTKCSCGLSALRVKSDEWEALAKGDQP